MLHIARRGPRLAPPSTTVGATGNQDDAKGQTGRQRHPRRPRVLCRGKALQHLPGRGPTPGDALLRVAQGGALLPAPLLQPPVRESWIRGYPDSRNVYFGRTVGLWRYKIEDFVPCPDGTLLGMEGKLGDSDVDLLLCKPTLCNPSPLRHLYKSEGLVCRTQQQSYHRLASRV